MDRQIGEVAALTGLTLRTLRYWDEMEVVSPSGRSHGGYRLYSDADVVLLQRAMIYRAAGMSLDQIREILTDGESLDHLFRQRDLLVAKQADLQSMLTVVDALVEEAMKKELNADEISKVMGHDVAQYAEEAESRWGDTEDWAISQQRSASRTASGWDEIKAETDRVESAIASAMNRGVEPGSVEGNDLADQHRELLSIHFPVSLNKHMLIAYGYTDDQRFTEYYDKRQVGLAAYLRSLIEARGRADGLDPETVVWE